MTIKKSVQTKYRLPVLNWVAMKPNQVKGTVFSELDDEKLYTVRHQKHHVQIFCIILKLLLSTTLNLTLNSYCLDSVRLKVIDFCRFEEMFKLNQNRMAMNDTPDGDRAENRKTLKKETISLLETNRLRNVGKK